MDVTENLYPKQHQKWKTLQSRGSLIQRKKASNHKASYKLFIDHQT